MNALSLYMHAVLCVECIMIVRMTLCSLDWVSVLCVATCVNKVMYAGCVYKLKCLTHCICDNFYYSHTLRSISYLIWLLHCFKDFTTKFNT